MSLSTLTPQQAASRVNVSRGTIMNAIKNVHLVAKRDNRNRWQIDPDDLSKWLSGRAGNVTVNAAKVDSQPLPYVDKNLVRLAVLEAELESRDQRIADLERDRDAWKAQAQDLARRDAPQGQIDPPPPRRWWPWRRT